MPRFILKEDSETYQKILELEEYLEKNNIRINGIEFISINDREFLIKDTDASTEYPCLPRSFDTQKFVLIEVP